MSQVIGKPIDRVDGRLKVTGKARYTADVSLENLAYGVILGSAIAKGRMTQIDTTAAEAAPGFLGILTHLNVPKLNPLTFFPGGQTCEILKDDTIYYSGQPIAILVAQTLEQAQAAAALVKIDYAPETPTVSMAAALAEGFEPESIFGGLMPAKYSRGDIVSGRNSAEVLIEQTYTTPMEHHNPMEPSATTAVWDGDFLTLYETTQGISGTQQTVAKILDMPPENIRVISEFVGGGFGCKGFIWPHTILGAIAARHVQRPVKLVLTRQQMYVSCGYRSPTEQHLTLGATKDGQLTVISHTGNCLTSHLDDFVEPVGSVTRMMYACPNVATKYRVGRIDAGTPTFTRGPGEAPGMFALESAMDELAYALDLDPIALRLRNYTDVDPSSGNPWSSNSLKECYQQGAELFGWSQRNPVPGSMKHGEMLVGMGMASATFPVMAAPASAKAEIFANGQAVVQSGTHDIGTGTYTIMTQVAAEALGLESDRVRFELGDTKLPKAPLTGGSMTTGSVGPAVKGAALAVRDKAIKLALEDARSPLYQYPETEIGVNNGRLFVIADPTIGETYQELLTRHGLESIDASHQTGPNAKAKQYGMHSYGSCFAEVQVDPLLGEIRVTRIVGVYGAGRILNPKTSRSQMIGGIVWGLGMALMEDTVMDPHMGRILNANFSDYLVPVHTDIPDIQVQFVPEEDPHVNALGTKGIGELSTVGVAGAIANAVYHATGKRIRNLPITPDKLL